MPKILLCIYELYFRAFNFQLHSKGKNIMICIFYLKSENPPP